MGEIFTEHSERNNEGELISVTINYGVIRAAEIDRKDNSSLDKSNYKVVKKGDIAYNSMRMWQGASGYSPYTGILSPAYTVIEPKRNQNSKFYAFMFKLNNLIQVFQKNSQGLTSDTWNLKFPTFSKIKVMVPQKEEQDRIEDILEQIDSLIASNQLQQKRRFLDLRNVFLSYLYKTS